MLPSRHSEVPFLTPWAFEFTPASAAAADEVYLRKVRDADIVLWLTLRGFKSLPLRSSRLEPARSSRSPETNTPSGL
jgi:hypothetical protein